MNQQTKYKAARADWRTRSKYVTLNLSPEDYTLLQTVAAREGKAVARQGSDIVRTVVADLWLLPKTVQEAESELHRLACNILSNTDQLTNRSPRLKKVLDEGKYYAKLAQLMYRIEDSVELRCSGKQTRRKGRTVVK
jgi:hypothetical protein